MKISKVVINNKKKTFIIISNKQVFEFPYSKLKIKPSCKDRIIKFFVDRELGNEAFSYVLESGKEGTVHIDQVLEYNQDSEYLREMLLYKLTLQAQKLIEKQKISRREVIRRLGTSPTQFYRLIDQTFYNKTIDQMIKLLAALDCHIEIKFKKAA